MKKLPRFAENYRIQRIQEHEQAQRRASHRLNVAGAWVLVFTLAYLMFQLGRWWANSTWPLLP